MSFSLHLAGRTTISLLGVSCIMSSFFSLHICICLQEPYPPDCSVKAGLVLGFYLLGVFGSTVCGLSFHIFAKQALSFHLFLILCLGLSVVALDGFLWAVFVCEVEGCDECIDGYLVVFL
jgi:hypothetical protein